MGERYSSREGVERAEQSREAIGDSHHPVLRNAPLIAATLAVLAGLSSLYSSRLGESMLSLTNPSARRKLAGDDATYRTRQQPLRAAALKKERERDADSEAADNVETRKAAFDAAVALFEIAIVLASVAAMVRRPWVAVLAAVFGIVALAAAARGFFA